MSGRTKIQDRAAEQVDELRVASRQYFMDDGFLSSCEMELLDRMDRIYALLEEIATRRRLGRRIEDGGDIDRGLMLQVKDCLELLVRAGEMSIKEEPARDELT